MTSLKNSDLPGAHSPTRGAQRCGRLLACTAVRTSLCRGRSSLRSPSHARGTEWGAAGRRSSRLVPHGDHINLRATVRGITRDRRMRGGDPLSLVATSASGRPREATPRGGRSCRGDCRSRRPCWLRWLWGGGGRARLLRRKTRRRCLSPLTKARSVDERFNASADVRADDPQTP